MQVCRVAEMESLEIYMVLVPNTTLNFYLDWVRDVAWAPNTGMPYNIIASCSEDRTVYIWKQTEANGVWTPALMHKFDAPVWRLSWSVTGNVLAVSTGDHMVTLWKQSVDETWVQITSVDDTTNTM
jgi:protein transport protein SEC13